MRAMPLLALALLVAAGAIARASDQVILGRTLQVKDPGTAAKRKLVVKAKEAESGAAIAGNPVVAGATLTVRVDGASPSSQSFDLAQGIRPSSGKPYWSGDAVKGFKYGDPKGEQGPIAKLSIKKSPRGTFTLAASGSGKFMPLTV